MINKKILSEIRVKWFKYRYYSLILLYICISVSFSIFFLSPIKLKVKNNTIKYEQKYNKQHDLTFNAEINNKLYQVIVKEKDSCDTYEVTCKRIEDCCFNYYMTDYINIKKITTGNLNVFYYNPTNRWVIIILLISSFTILGLFLFIDGKDVCDYIYVNYKNEIYLTEDSMWKLLIPSERYVIIILNFLGYDYDSEK